MIFDERLTELRKELGVTQKDFAEKLQIEPSKYNKWENGKTVPDFDTVIRLANSFGVTVDYLVGNSDVRKWENVDIHSKLGLSDYSIDMLRTYNDAFGGDYLIPIVNFLIEQEMPLYFGEEENNLLNWIEDFNHRPGNEKEIEHIEAARKKLDDDFNEWQSTHIQLLKKIEDYFSVAVNNEKLYITATDIKKENEIKHNQIFDNIISSRTVKKEKVVDQVFLSEIEDALKQLKNQYSEKAPERYSIHIEEQN